MFYKGRAPKGVKTDWIMHEYRLAEGVSASVQTRRKESLRVCYFSLKSSFFALSCTQYHVHCDLLKIIWLEIPVRPVSYPCLELSIFLITNGVDLIHMCEASLVSDVKILYAVR